MAEMELRRLRHDPLEIVTRAIQPILWVAVFGTVMARVRAFPSVGDYVTFIAPGVVLQSSTFIALAYGIMLVFERESGILKKLLSTPIPRSYIVLGRSLAGAIRASTQYVIVLASAAAVGARITNNPINLVLGYLILTYSCMGFTSLSILIASALKTRERFMGIIGAITMPLFFASNALYPLEVMPPAIQALSLINPLTYTVSALRTLLVVNTFNILNDFLAITAFVVVSIAAAMKTLNRIIE
ncbi:MAG: multidrug ABC transporter permease [Zestosphaera tikiterensis]|uniref:Multidrug ABC transporter permease n=1 Tax=Zestosphaera tikiterensis TaxID=1973259 RepID=A0A2R7Y868_9CREN|nr:MAG: multidrug ABC transporter permease [Zestosphaera tikiterensis]